MSPSQPAESVWIRIAAVACGLAILGMWLCLVVWISSGSSDAAWRWMLGLGAVGMALVAGSRSVRAAYGGSLRKFREAFDDLRASLR